MKTPIRTRFLTIVGLALLGLGSSSFLDAADPAAAPKDPKSLGAELGFDENTDIVISEGSVRVGDLKLPATLGNVVDALRIRYPKANIAIAPGLSDARITDLKLHVENLRDEIQAIRVASADAFDWSGPGSLEPNRGAVDPATGLPLPGTDPNKGLYVLREPARNPGTEQVVEAFNIGSYLDWIKSQNESKDTGPTQEEIAKNLDRIQDIIMETISAVQPKSTPLPHFRFHQSANIFIVIGTQQGVEIARKIITALPGTGTSEQRSPGFGAGGASGAAPLPEAFVRRYGLNPPAAGVKPAPAPAPKPPKN
jgi:hypothetical protein